VCDNKNWDVPELMEEPQQVDYLTDDESDEEGGFEIPVPDLDELIKEFEVGDDVIEKEVEEFDAHLADLKQRGFEKEPREEIKQTKDEKTRLLDENMSNHRQLLGAGLPGMVEDLNAVIVQARSKLSLT